jgi:GNAT superfamily N-acetyltransferase
MTETNLKPICWEKAALDYELEYSKARGSILEVYPDFIHISNRNVHYGGDYNRTVSVRARTPERFREILGLVEKMHERDGALPPDRFDFFPPVLGPEWEAAADSLGYRLKTSVYLQAPALPPQSFPPYRLHSPAAEEFEQWYTAQQKANPYCTEQLLKEIVPRQMKFIKVFNPFWLMKDESPVGWVYCQLHNGFFNVFELELLGEYRGKGLGRVFMQLIRAESGRLGARSVLVQTTQKIKDFYIKSGFSVASENTVLVKK